MLMLSIAQQKSFVAASSGNEGLPNELASDREFWRSLYASLAENAMVSVLIVQGTQVDQVESFMKMNGFANIQLNQNDGVLVATKPLFKAGGTSLKNRKKKVAEPENPWGNLQTNGDA